MARKPKINPTEDDTLAGLEAVLGHTFARPALLTLALTHRSFVYDAGGAVAGGDPADPAHDNEQLEFVGDAILGLLAAESLWRRFPGSREGDLTRMRAAIVSRKNLGEVGVRLGIARWLRLGHTAEQNAARTNAALAANALEAIIAALYLDGGLEIARAFVEREVMGDPASDAGGLSLQASARHKDHKTALQEWLQAQARGRPEYRLSGESGPEHRRTFRVEVRLTATGAALAEGEGTTRKQAEQEAARQAIGRLHAQAEGAASPEEPVHG